MRRYALVVGIGQYQQLPSLSKPAGDARAVYDLLDDHGNFDDIHPLLDAEATYAALVRELEYVLLEQGDRAEVLLYFTGHGFTAGPNKRAKQGYLATHNCKVKQDRDGNVTYAEDALSFQELNALIEEAKPARLAMLLDCCHSEFFVEQTLIGRGLSGFGDRGYFLSAACRSYEKAWANPHENHSVYTGALLQTLQDEQTPEITASEAHNSIQRQLKGSGQEPIPFGYGDSLALVTCVQEVTTGVSEECPYQGLNAFTPETERFFKGRENEKALLRKKLNRSNFLLVLGPSGIGKSSVVRAGLLTQLPQQDWCVVTMKPGSAPVAELTRQMRGLWAELGLSTGEQRELAQVLEAEGLLALAEKLPTEKRVLLLVDQFEEVFTQCAESKEAERDRFIQDLVRVGKAKTPLSVVMTMRSDFVNEWLMAGQPPEVMSNDTVCLGPLMGDHLRAAIEDPAKIQEYRFGPGLLELVLADVSRERNFLPLLEFALTELWEKRDEERRELTAAAYCEMGRLSGTLDRQAEAVYDRWKQRPEEQKWVKRVCLQLVRIGRDEKDTRQRQPKHRLLEMGSKDEQTRQTIADVVSDLVKGRLLVSDGGFVIADEEEIETDSEEAVRQCNSVEYVDLAHEALLEGWIRFKEWRQEDRDLLRLEQRLKDAYEDWQGKEEGKEREKYLLTGGLLAEVREQRAVLSDRLSDSRPELMAFFADSDQKDVANVEKLKSALAEAKKALALANVQEASRKVRDKLLFTPTQTVEATVEAIRLVGKSQEDFNRVIHPSQDSLNRAFANIRERLKVDGYGGAVGLIAFSPDGNRIVSSSANNTLRLWDLQGNPIGNPFEGHSDVVFSVAFSPEGSRIVSASRDETIRLWDLHGNAIGMPFEGHRGMVKSVAFSPEGDRIVSGSDDRTLRLWDLRGNEIGTPFQNHSVVSSVAFSPKGDCIASSSNGEKTLRLWDLEGKVICESFEGHSDVVFSVAFSPKGDQIISGSEDNTLRLWDLDGNAIRNPFEGHSDAVLAVAFSPEGNRIISSSRDSTIRIWDLDGNEIGLPFEGHSSMVSSVSFSPGGDLVVSSSKDSLRLWNTEGNVLGKCLDVHNDFIDSVVFDSRGDRLIFKGRDGVSHVCDLEGNAVEILSGESEVDRVPVVSDLNEGQIISISSDGLDDVIVLWDLERTIAGMPLDIRDRFFYDIEGVYDRFANPIAVSPQGDRIVSRTYDGALRLWDLQGNPIGEPFIDRCGLVSSVAFNPKGDRIISGSHDGTLQLWDLQGRPIGEPFVGHSDMIRSVDFSPSGDWVVSGSSDKTLRLWDLSGNSVSQPFIGHSGWVWSVAFSPKGDRVASGSSDKTLRLWDSSGNPIGEPLRGHSGWIRSVAFSSKGDQLVSGSSDGTLRLWRVGTWEDELRYCCNMLMHHTALAFPQTETARQACEVCQQVWTRQQSAEFLVAQGNALARRGEIDKAAGKFKEAKALDPELTIDPTARAQELADWSQSSTATP